MYFEIHEISARHIAIKGEGTADKNLESLAKFSDDLTSNQKIRPKFNWKNMGGSKNKQAAEEKFELSKVRDWHKNTKFSSSSRRQGAVK
jgi:hypothetical protein